MYFLPWQNKGFLLLLLKIVLPRSEKRQFRPFRILLIKREQHFLQVLVVPKSPPKQLAESEIIGFFRSTMRPKMFYVSNSRALLEMKY